MLGGLWYTALFGKTWQKAHAYDDAKMKELQAKRPPPVFFGLMIVCYAIVALAMAFLVQSAEVHTIEAGASLGFAVWLIVAAVTLTNHLPTHVTWAGFFIDVSYAFLYCLGTGAILGAWR
jgi:hypothetical protein